MLSPRYLDGLSDELVEIYSQLETDILQDMARRIKKIGSITDATKWQAQMLTEAGGLKASIAKTLKKYDKTIVDQVTKTYTEALKKNAENDSKIFVKALGRTVSAPNAQQMLATIQKCHSDLSRLTLTTAATSQTLFVQQANRVYMDVQSGAFDYDTAMKSAADAMAERGITTVQYENGRPVTRTIESAIRMNILTSINQTAANMTLNNCEELDCDLVETSAHIGARPEHEEWQGQIFSRSGNNPKYRPFSVCELGSVTGICGINCRHSFYPYFEGMHEHYTQDDLDEMANEKVTYNGKEMTRYEGEQAQRKIERQIRYYKRRALTEEAAGIDNTAARVKLGEWQARARDFTQQTGLRRDPAREFIGTKDGKQPRAIKPTITQPQETKPTLQPNSTPTETAQPQKNDLFEKLTPNDKSFVRKALESANVETLDIKTLPKETTENDIITKIGGGDRTKGSCVSLSFAYASNKAGFDVLDFRGGKSQAIFCKMSNIKEICKLNGVISKEVKDVNDFTAVKTILQDLTKEKEYCLVSGKHAAIIRQTEKSGLQYLELQSQIKCGYNPLNDQVLKNRFGCKRSHSTYGDKYEASTLLIDIETLAKNREFMELMKYINTLATNQLKGISGGVK